MSGRIYDYSYLPITDDNPFPTKGRILDANGNPITSANPLPISGIFATGILPGSGARSTSFPITTTGVPLRIGATQVPKRRCLMISNDSSTNIFINADPAFPAGTSFMLVSGQLIQVLLDPNNPREIYAKTNYFNTTVTLFEVGA